ncbi:MAG: ABC transporter ATP-binding protein [Bacteroidia bacterium]
MSNDRSRFLILDIVRRIGRLLPRHQQRGGMALLAGIIFNGVLDVFGLATILPVISIAVDPGIIQKHAALQRIYDLTGLQEVDHFLILLIALLFVIFAVKNIIGLLINYQQVSYSFSVAEDLSRRQFLYYFRRGYQFIRTVDTGLFITNVKNIPSFFAQGILISLVNFFSEVFVVSVILAGIALVDFRLLLSLGVILGSGFVLIYRAVKSKVYQLGEARKVVAPQTVTRINETLGGYTDVTIFNKIRFFLDKFSRPMHREYVLTKDQTFYNLIPPRANEVIAILGISLVFLYGILFAEGRQELFFLLSLMAAAAYRIMPSMNRTLVALMTIKSNLYTLDILDELTQTNTTLRDTPPVLRIDTSIEIRELGFHFEDAETPVLQDVNVQVQKGECIGFIGESGSGKSTLMRILLRLLREDSGGIYIDGVKLDETNEQAWQLNIGYVQQDVFIMEGSLLENIAFGVEPEAIEASRVKQAVQQAGLEKFVDSLPQGLETPIGEAGSRLSGGQKQRLAIARALYQDVEVFVFDEATSALDSETEAIVTESIAQLAQRGKTIFLIAHRLTTLHTCDRIYELKAGRICAVYSYDEMLRVKLGLVKEIRP